MRVASWSAGSAFSFASSRSRWIVLSRAMSRLALRISVGVSSRSVADWKRRWNRCFSVSFRVSAELLVAHPPESFILVGIFTCGESAESCSVGITDTRHSALIYIRITRWAAGSRTGT